MTKLLFLLCLQQTDVPEVNGYTEFMGWTIINGTDEATPLVGIQKNSTLPALYSIDAKNTTTGLSFSWQFVGVQDSQVGSWLNSARFGLKLHFESTHQTFEIRTDL